MNTQPITQTPSTHSITTDFTVTLKDTVSNVDRNVNFYTIHFTWKQKKVWKTTPKRYSEFEEFNTLIKHITQDPLIIQLPPKLYIHTREGLEIRKKGLMNYVYSITKSSTLIQIPEVRKFFEIPSVVQMYYQSPPQSLPDVAVSDLPESVQQMYQDGCKWANHFSKTFVALHQLPSFVEQEDYFEKNKKLVDDMRQFFHIQMSTFGKLIKEKFTQILKDVFSVSHLLWMWISNMPQIVHAMNTLPPSTFIDVTKYMNKETGEISIPTSITQTTGNAVQDYFIKIDKLKKRAAALEEEVLKNGFVANNFTKGKINELYDEIQLLLDGVISYNQFINADNCLDVKEMYLQATDLDIAFSKRLAILIDKRAETECKQKTKFVEAKGTNNNSEYVMVEMYQPFTL